MIRKQFLTYFILFFTLKNICLEVNLVNLWQLKVEIRKFLYLTFYPRPVFGLRVLSLPASVRPSPSLSARLLITRSSQDHQIWTKDSKHLGQGPYCFGEQSTLISKVKFNLKAKFTPFWACPYHNSSPIEARITKFGPDVQIHWLWSLLFWRPNWPWPSRSNLT